MKNCIKCWSYPWTKDERCIEDNRIRHILYFMGGYLPLVNMSRQKGNDLHERRIDIISLR